MFKATAALPPGRETRYPFCRRLGASGPVGKGTENLAPRGVPPSRPLRVAIPQLIHKFSSRKCYIKKLTAESYKWMQSCRSYQVLHIHIRKLQSQKTSTRTCVQRAYTEEVMSLFLPAVRMFQLDDRLPDTNHSAVAFYSKDAFLKTSHKSNLA